MTVVATIQLLEDGNENTILRFVGTVDAAQANTVLIDPATLSDIGPYAGLKAGKLRVKKVIFALDDAITMQLLWDATTALEFDALEGRDTHDYRDAGGLQNNSGVGRTGKILYNINFTGAAALSDFAVSLYLGETIMTFAIGDLVMWKGIECKVVAVNEETIQANKTDEAQSLRVIDLPSAFTAIVPPAVEPEPTPSLMNYFTGIFS